ncbi:MAG TPA: hypothetical protein VK464_14155 [Symbiobacteriaceae bacterium]|jgi:hypothetical protein|nr:hypothetical protein [Symbiobacteriaceae bacterium]
MAELEQLVGLVERTIHQHLRPSEFHPCKVSVWIKLVRPAKLDGVQVEETVGDVHKVVFQANSSAELVREIADNLVLAVFGGDVQIVQDVPNLIVKLFDQKTVVPMPGAPPLDQAGQTWLKATVYRFEPSLWDHLFKRED